MNDLLDVDHFLTITVYWMKYKALIYFLIKIKTIKNDLHFGMHQVDTQQQTSQQLLGTFHPSEGWLALKQLPVALPSRMPAFELSPVSEALMI